MKTAGLMLSALAVLSTTCALAGEPRKRSDDLRTVSYAGLDLNTRAGVATLYRRLHVAAQGVCRDLYTLELGQRRQIWLTCVRNALARAVVDVDVPALTAYATTRIGDPRTPVAVTARR